MYRLCTKKVAASCVTYVKLFVQNGIFTLYVQCPHMYDAPFTPFSLTPLIPPELPERSYLEVGMTQIRALQVGICLRAGRQAASGRWEDSSGWGMEILLIPI